jgi:hypothetical protein
MEPVKKNRWIMKFDAIPGSKKEDAVNALALVAHTCNAPTLTFAQTEYQRMNETFYTAGKPKWNEINMTFFDFIREEGDAGQPSTAAELIYEWSRSIYNPVNGAMGYKSKYTTNARLVHLDPLGEIIRGWNLFYIWPATFNFGDGLSSDEEGLLDISVTFRYDTATMDAYTTGITAKPATPAS